MNKNLVTSKTCDNFQQGLGYAQSLYMLNV